MTIENFAHNQVLDRESDRAASQLSALAGIRAKRVPGVRTVLVVLSANAMVYDKDSIRRKITVSYPDAAVFYYTAAGTPVGMAAPRYVDLLVDLTAPGQREPWFFAKRLRRMSRVAVGRKAGWLRSKFYDRVFNEAVSSRSKLPHELLERERYVQTSVFELAGIAF